MSSCVVIPVFNEGGCVDRVLDAVREHFAGEIVVIDDGSTDESALILARRSDVTLVRLDCNCGYGCALRIGLDVALQMGHDTILTMDCDGQHEPAHIPQFLAAMEANGADIISGSRYLPGSSACGAAPADRRELNAEITALINDATGWNLTDSFCGFKAYRSTALRGLELVEDGYAMPIELWARAYRAGLAVKEIAVERIYYDHSRSFGGELDDPGVRRAYYLETWKRSLAEDHS